MRYCPECGYSDIKNLMCPKCQKTFNIKTTPTLFPDIIKYRAEIAKLNGFITQIQMGCDHELVETEKFSNLDDYGRYNGYTQYYRCLKCDQSESKDV